MCLRGESLNAGQARKARNSENARWIERASVSLSTPTRNTKGSGDAYHSWNSDQASAVPKTSCLATPRGSRRPVSTSATSSCNAAGAFSMSVAMGGRRRSGVHKPIGKGGPAGPSRPSLLYLIQPFSL